MPFNNSIAIDSIEPDYGTNAGGTLVEIRGGPFNQNTQVKFGNSSGTIRQASQNLLLVETNSNSQEGLVDISVTNSNANGSEKSAFTFWSDATGMGGAYGEVAWFDLVGKYWSDVGEMDSGAAWWTLISPTSQHYYHWAFAPSDDTCATEYLYSNTMQNYNLGLYTTSLNLNGRSIYLNDVNSNQMWQADLYSGDFVNQAIYGLDEVVPTNFPSFSMQEMTQTPSSFSVTQPYLADLLDYPVVSRSFPVSWSGANSDRMIIIAMRYELDATDSFAIQDTVSCVVSNPNGSGTFYVPSSAFTSWNPYDMFGDPYNQLIVLYVGALNEGGGTFPFNNSESWVSSIHFVSGVVLTQ